MALIKFGTDGWRGVIARDFTFDRVAIAAAAAGQIALEQEAKPTAMVGYDRRFLSREFGVEVARVLAAQGIKVLLSQQFCSTPCTSFVARREKTPLSPMLTASHNPAIWNGFKMKGPHGGPATPEQTKPVQARATLLEDSGFVPERMDWDEALRSGAITEIDASGDYLAEVKRHVDAKALSSAKFKVVLDSMYGSGSGYLKTLLAGFGVEAIELRSECNPSFGGINPEPIEPNLEVLINKVRETGAGLGLATDGDADRLGVVDENGRFISSQEVFPLLLMHLFEDLGMTGDVVAACSSTIMLPILCTQYGLEFVETPVGFKDVCSYMITHDSLIGGEESGGYGIKGHLPERDGVLCGLLLIQMMVHRGKKMSELVADLMKKAGFHTFRRNDVHTTPEKKEEALRRTREAAPDSFGGIAVKEVSRLDGYKAYLEDGSWLLVRASGTEPLLRIYCEAVSDEALNSIHASAKKQLLDE
jgi:phosphomannomutase